MYAAGLRDNGKEHEPHRADTGAASFIFELVARTSWSRLRGNLVCKHLGNTS
jgi:hypothetical protein